MSFFCKTYDTVLLKILCDTVLSYVLHFCFLKSIQFSVITLFENISGIIPLFHAKVMEKNFGLSQSLVPLKDNAGESSHRKIYNTPVTVTEEIQIDDDDDDEVAIINSPTVPSSSSGEL